VTWTQKQKILASDLASNDFFGTSVTMSAGASVVVIGADGETSQAGAAYVFAS
jgi:phage gp45-like